MAAGHGGEEDTMSKGAMDAWLVQLFGVVLAAVALFLWHRFHPW